MVVGHMFGGLLGAASAPEPEPSSLGDTHEAGGRAVASNMSLEEVVPVSEHELQQRLNEQAGELDELREVAHGLEEEVVTLRRRLQDAPKRVRTLEERLLETKGQLQQAVSQNEKLTYTLREARDHIAALREEVEKLTQPPAAYGTVLGANDDGTVDVHSGGRKMRVAVIPELAGALAQGDEVALNESFSVILSRSSDRTGEVVTVKDAMDSSRALIVGRGDEERVCELAGELEVGS